MISKVEHWTRSVITGVHWEDRKATSNFGGAGLLQSNTIMIWIPTNGRTVTIKAGDVVVKNQVGDAVDPTTFTMTDLKVAYPDVVTVRSVGRYDYGSPSMSHLQIEAS